MDILEVNLFNLLFIVSQFDSTVCLYNVQVDPTGPTANEYAEIVHLFGATMSDSVMSIKRIQNVELWDRFYRYEQLNIELWNGFYRCD